MEASKPDFRRAESAAPRAWYACTLPEFLRADPDDVVRRLIERSVVTFRQQEREQTAAWRETIETLQKALAPPSVSGALAGMLLEFPILRLGRRIDVILLRGDVVIVIEVKAGAGVRLAEAFDQVEDYALCLRDFHEPSRNLSILPVAAGAGAGGLKRRELGAPIDQIAPVIALELSDVGWAVELSKGLSQAGRAGPAVEEFDSGAYHPTPDIVEAARQAYASHEVEAVRRADASGLALEAARVRLARIVKEARDTRRHAICFVNGTPGSGKTLLGLDLVLGDRAARRIEGEPAALLSGNRPLVRVLQQALIDDEAERTGKPKKNVRLKVEGALQTLLGYLKTHADPDSAAPPEHVVVFDEAQRAWDAETGLKLLGRRASEPELFLEILGRLDWACLVCLVGGGQEINRGELGLPLWIDAIVAAARRGEQWAIHGPPGCLEDGRAEMGLPPAETDLREAGLELQPEERFALLGSVRAFRNDRQTSWLSALLAGDIEGARREAEASAVSPAYLCRDLGVTRAWLRARQRGGRRIGLVASAGGARLRAEGLADSPESKDLNDIANWFLKPSSDFRSSDALEVPLSEYAIQGLEIDYAGVCWDGDLIWREGEGWIPRKMSAPKWQVIRSAEERRHRINSYRVLLSRSRAGQIIFVPKGDASDPTRDPRIFDEIARVLREAGCRDVDAEAGPASAPGF